MRQIKMIVTDMDGTLYDSEKKISLENYEAIKSAREQGYLFAIATGRSIDNFINLIQKTPIKAEIDYIIGYNGACIYDTRTRETTQYYELKPEVLRDIAHFCKKIGVNPAYYDYDNVLKVERENAYTATIGSLYDLKIVQADIEKDVKRSLPKMIAYVQEEDMKRVEALVAQHTDPRFRGFKSAPTILEFVHPDCSKDKAIARLCAKHGFSMHQVLAFGDTTNDLEMLSNCYGVCMKNGTDDAKAAANIVNPYTNDESGVGRFLKESLLHH